MNTIAYIRSTNIYDESRATKEIVAFAKAGYRVKVLGWNRNGRAKTKFAEVFESWKNQVSCEFYDVEAENGIGMRNISKLLGWFKWVHTTLKNSENVDIVHACDLDAGVGAYIFCRKHGKAMVYDIYDYYVDTHNVPGVLSAIVEAMEISIINHAEVTIICTEERREQISKAAPRKVLVLHNSPDVDVPAEEFCDIDYTYCGALIERRLIGEILEGYEDNSDLRFSFAGHGPLRVKAKQLDEQFGNFSFKGEVPYSEVLIIESRAMAISAIYEPTTRNHRLCAPNKFYEALALAKPVIVCRGTGIDVMVEKNDIGIVIDYNAEEFYRAIRYLKSNPDRCREMGKRARELYEEKYRWSVMEKKLLDTYRQI